MRQRASQPSPSRKYQWRETPVARYYLRRQRLVFAAWAELQEADRVSYEKLIRDMPPYEPSLAAEAQVQFIREGGEVFAA